MFEVTTRTVEAKSAIGSVQKRLEECGYRKIGRGAYATVWGAPGVDHVYKIGLTDENEGYLRFLTAVRQSKEPNPYLPNVEAVQFVEGKVSSLNAFVAKLERLEELSMNEMDLAAHLLDFVTIQAEGRNSKEQFRRVNRLGFVSFDNAFLKAIELIFNIIRKNCVEPDLHGGNVMRRGRQLVITDPIA